MSSRKQIQAVFFSLIMLLSVVGMGAGGAAAQPADANLASEEVEPIHESIDTEIAPQLESASGETTLLLKIDRNIDVESSQQAGADTLQSDSQATLSPVATEISQFEAAEVKQQFWVGNVISVTADLDTHSVEDFASIPGVVSITPNIEAETPAQPSVGDVAADNQVTTEQNHNGYTYGLEQIDIPGFEEQYNASGEGSSVVVIDDGISNPDEGHPDLDFATEAVATDGEVTTGTLGGPGSHGEHVAGTATGAENPVGDVPRYGVAPNASLTNINAFEEGAFLEDLLASVQFAVENDADVASMSLGFPSPDDRATAVNLVTDQMEEANEAGTIVVVSAGNSGSLENPDSGGPVTSPAAEFRSFSVGASTSEADGPLYGGSENDIAYFSSGMVINDRSVVDPTGGTFDYPDTYPREYVQPDVSAPGLFILSSGPLGGDIGDANATYSESSGTSMAAPHVTGAIALVQSATEDDLGPEVLQASLAETAEKPENNFTELNSRDIRYGTGIINVTAATMAASSENLEINGTVTDSDGDPITGATVESEEGALTTTDEDGEYVLHTTSSETNVTADDFGYAAETVSVNESGTQDFELEDQLELDLISGQPDSVETGGSFDIEVDAGSLDELTVDLSNESTFRVQERDLTLSLNGDANAIDFGETVEFEDRFTGTATLTVEVDHDADISSGDEIVLDHTFAGAGDEAEVTTGPTEIIDSGGTGSSVEVDADIVGTVSDEPTTMVTATGLVSDGEPSDGEKVTFTIGGEAVATAQTDEGEATAEVESETLDIEPQEDVTVDILEFDANQTDEVDVVHETRDLEEGFNLLSVSQPAEVTTENVSSVNIWDSASQSYEGVSSSTFDSASDLHNGLYVEGNADDARFGLTYNDDVPAGGTEDVNAGWNFVGSNFALDTTNDTETTIEQDLAGVDASALELFASDFSGPLNPSDTVGAYDAYWAYNPTDEADERGVVASSYNVEDRRDTLGQGESNFDVNITDVSTTSIEDADSQLQLDNRNVVGDSEQVVVVDANIENTDDQDDVQLIDLEFWSPDSFFGLTDFERVDQTGLELGDGESDNVTLTYIASQDDAPGLPAGPFFVDVISEDTDDRMDGAFESGGVSVDDQALTSDGEFIVDNVDIAGDGTVQLNTSSGDTLDSQSFTSGINSEVVFDDFDAANVSVGDNVTVAVVDDDGSALTSADAEILESVTVTDTTDSSFALVNETATTTFDVDNNALEQETADVEFEVELNGDNVANETREDVDLASGFNGQLFDVDTQAIGAEVGDDVTATATVLGSSDDAELTVAESTLQFNDQSIEADDGSPSVLVEEVTATSDQQVVVTDTDYNVLSTVSVGDINGEDVEVPLDSANAEDHIAHVVSGETDVSAEGPGLVNEQATVTTADVTIDEIGDSSYTDDQLPVDVVEEVTVDAEVTDTVGDRNGNFTVEIRDDSGTVVGESGTINDSATDLTVELDDPITVDSAGASEFTLDAVLVDQTGEEFQQSEDGTFTTIDDSTTFTVDVDEAGANVALPDQALGAADGSDAVYVDDVTGEAGQFVAITAADNNSEILGSTQLDTDVAGDQIIVDLDEEIDAGEYRAHLTSDVGLVGGNEPVTDAGTVFEDTLEFNNQTFVGATDEVTVATADLLDGADNTTTFGIAIHENGSASGDIIGTAEGLTGANDGVTVNLDEEITEEGDYVAMLHESPVESDNAITQADGSSVVPVTDGATITPVDSQVTFNDQDASASGVVVEDVAADNASTIVLTYTDDNSDFIVAGSATIDDVETAGGAQNVTIGVQNTTGVPGDHTAHVIPTDDLSSEYAPGDTVSENTTANVTSADSATVYDAELTFADQAEEDETSTVTIDTANVSDGIGDETEFGVSVESTDGTVVGSATGLTGTNSDVTVTLNQSINTSTTFDATLTAADGEPLPIAAANGEFGEITDSADVTIQSAEGADLEFNTQAVGTDADGNDAVLVENIVEATQEEQLAVNDVSDPTNDYVVLFEGDEVDADNIVAYEPISEANNDGDLTINLSDVDVTPGNHRVEIHANASGAPDPAQPRGAATTATVLDGDVNVTTELLDETEEPLDEIDVDSELLDGANVEYNVSVTGDATGEVTGLTGTNSDTVTLDSDLADQEEVTATVEVDGQDIQQADGTAFTDLADTQTIEVIAADFQLSGVELNNSVLADSTVEEDKDVDPVPVDFTVSNNGGATAAADIQLNISQDGEAVITRERTTPFELSPGDAYGSAFTNVDVGALAPGNYDVEVTTEDETVSGTLTVNGSNYQVDTLNIAGGGNDTTVVEESTPFTISVNAENIGNLAGADGGAQDVVLNVTDADGNDVYNETNADVEIGTDSSTPVEFTDIDPTADIGGPGEYTVTVSSDDDSVTGDLTVRELGFEMTDATVSPTSIDRGAGPVDVDFTVENQGDNEDTQDIDLEIRDDDGNVVVTETNAGVTLPGGGGSLSTTFGSVNVSGLATGTYDVVVSSDDSQASDTLTVDGGPSFATPTPNDGATVNDAGQTYTVDITDDVSSVNASTISVNVTDASGDVLTNAGTGTTGVSFAGTTLTIDQQTYADGSVDVLVSADDDAGNSQTFSSSFTVDTTAPTQQNVALTDDVDGNGVVADGDSVTISTDISDSDVASVEADASAFGAGTVTLDDGNDDGTYDTTITVATSGADTASATVDVTATDTAGNADTTTSTALEIDNTSPSISGVTLGENNGEVTLSFDTDEDLSSISVSIDGPSTNNVYTFDETDFDSTSGTVTLTTTQAYDDGNGDYTVTVDDAIDSAGNNGGENGDGTGLTDTNTF